MGPAGGFIERWERTGPEDRLGGAMGKKRKVFLLPPNKTVRLLITDPYLLPKLSKKYSTSSATF